MKDQWREVNRLENPWEAIGLDSMALRLSSSPLHCPPGPSLPLISLRYASRYASASLRDDETREGTRETKRHGGMRFRSFHSVILLVPPPTCSPVSSLVSHLSQSNTPRRVM